MWSWSPLVPCKCSKQVTHALFQSLCAVCALIIFSRTLFFCHYFSFFTLFSLGAVLFFSLRVEKEGLTRDMLAEELGYDGQYHQHLALSSEAPDYQPVQKEDMTAVEEEADSTEVV